MHMHAPGLCSKFMALWVSQALSLVHALWAVRGNHWQAFPCAVSSLLSKPLVFVSYRVYLLCVSYTCPWPLGSGHSSLFSLLPACVAHFTGLAVVDMNVFKVVPFWAVVLVYKGHRFRSWRSPSPHLSTSFRDRDQKASQPLFTVVFYLTDTLLHASQTLLKSGFDMKGISYLLPSLYCWSNRGAVWITCSIWCSLYVGDVQYEFRCLWLYLDLELLTVTQEYLLKCVTVEDNTKCDSQAGFPFAHILQNTRDAQDTRMSTAEYRRVVWKEAVNQGEQGHLPDETRVGV